MVHLVADNPQLAALAGSDVVGAALGKLLVAAAVRNGARRLVAVVQPAEDAQPLIAPLGEVLAAAVVRIRPNAFGEDDPAWLAHLDHVMFAARLVDAKEIG